MQEIVNFVSANWASIATVLFVLSELLAQIPSIKANSVFQLLVNLLKKSEPPTPSK